MIFYFTGTDNSLYIARKIAEATGDRLTYIPDLLEERDYPFYEPEEGENIGFVFPVYFYSVPHIIDEFLHKFSLDGLNDHYLYLVLNCGGSTGIAGDKFNTLCSLRGWDLKYQDAVLMPDNYCVNFKMPSAEKQEEILDKADEEIQQIIGRILSHTEGDWNRHKGKAPILTGALVSPLYNTSRRASKFTLEKEKCLKCGRCAKDCPSKAISLGEDGMPRWKDVKCELCLRCVQRCPAACIQRGKGTAKNGRYHNPRV